jgi:hypothetical protein
MHHFKIAVGAVLFAVAVSTVLTFALGRSTPPPKPIVAATEPEPQQTIEEAYREVALSVLKSASLAASDPKPVPVEKIIPPIIPHVAVANTDMKVEGKREVSNLCSRNGRRKVWVTKYKWRCLK